MTIFSKTKKQNKTKLNKTKLNKTKLNKTKLNKTKLKTKNTGGGLSRNDYQYMNELADTMSPNKPETFKIEVYDYNSMTGIDKGWVQVGEITFSKKDIIKIENDAEGESTINQPIIHKTIIQTGIPYKGVAIKMPQNVELRFHFQAKKNSNISLYEKNTNKIVAASIRLVRTTGQLISSVVSKIPTLPPFRSSTTIPDNTKMMSLPHNSTFQ